MRLTVLGTGTALPEADRGPSGTLLTHGARSWLVDAGSGTLQRCVRAGVDPRKLHGAVFTHRHPDHCSDLVPLLFAMHTPPGRGEDFRIWAGTGFGDYMKAQFEIHGRWLTFGAKGEKGAKVFELSTEGPAEADIGGVKLVTRPANHSAGALHLRFEFEGMAIVFSGDTGPSDALAELATGAQLLVCECMASDERPIEGHLTPKAVGELVAKARPREVWLTHISPNVNPAEAVRAVTRAGAKVRRPNDLTAWEP